MEPQRSSVPAQALTGAASCPAGESGASLRLARWHSQGRTWMRAYMPRRAWSARVQNSV